MGIKKFFGGFRSAWQGICTAVETGRNIRLQLLAFAWVMLLVWVSGYGRDYYIPVVVISAAVLGMECMNSAVERLCDRVTTQREESIRAVKDMAAGGVLICAIMAVGVALFLFADGQFWKAVWSGIVDNDRGWALIALVAIPVAGCIMAFLPPRVEKKREDGEDEENGNN